MGAVVPALEFMLTLATECLLVLCVLTYAMHCLLVVVRDTAAGQDEVVWPDEPFQDWALGALHLVGVVLIVLAPAGILTRALRETWLPGDAALRFLLLAVPGLWLFLPVALFSSLSASSRWLVFRPVVVWNMLCVAPSAFAVYAVSAVLAAAVAALGYAAVTRWVVLAPIAAAAAGAAFLIYARLLGRLAWKMGRLPSGKRKVAKKARLPAGRVEVEDPWNVPAAPATPEPETETTPYGRTRKRVKGYGLAPEEPAKTPESAPADGYTPIAAEPKTAAIHPRRRRAAPAPLLAGVFMFPGYAQSRKAWLLLSLGFLAVCGCACALVHFYSALYGDG